MICDSQHRGLEPLVLHDIQADAEASELTQLLRLVLPLVTDSGGSVLLGRGRPRGTVPDDIDRAWHQCAIDLCGEAGVPLLGFYLATGDGVFRLPEPLTAAS